MIREMGINELTTRYWELLCHVNALEDTNRGIENDVHTVRMRADDWIELGKRVERVESEIRKLKEQK